jgi:hypothetical protein
VSTARSRIHALNGTNCQGGNGDMKSANVELASLCVILIVMGLVSSGFVLAAHP